MPRQKKLTVRKAPWDRAAQLAPRLREREEIKLGLGGVPGELDVLRMALDLGLDALEARYPENGVEHVERRPKRTSREV